VVDRGRGLASLARVALRVAVTAVALRVAGAAALRVAVAASLRVAAVTVDSAAALDLAKVHGPAVGLIEA